MSDRLPIEQATVTLVDDEEATSAFVRWMSIRNTGFVACDVETTGLQPFGPQRDHLRLVQFSDENTAWVLPVEHDPQLLALVDDAIDVFTGRLVGHNSPFDEAFLIEAGIPCGMMHDTYIAHHLLYPNDWHGLKPAASQLYGRGVRAGEKWLAKVKQRNGWDWATIPYDHPAYWGYGGIDTLLTARLATDLIPRVLAEYPEQYDRERRVAKMMKECSRVGVPVDKEYVKAIHERWGDERRGLEVALKDHSIDKPGSSAQIAACLKNDGWEPDLFTGTGRPCVNRQVLEGLNNVVAKQVLRHRRICKWDASYAQPLLKIEGDRCHPNISSMRAATGRMSIDSPPLHQFPRGPEVRSAILADEGMVMYAIDYVGQEMRELAVYVADPGFTNDVLYGGDVHGNIARALHGDDYTKDQRSWTKNAVYAWCYGAGAGQLALTAHAPTGATERAIKEAYPALGGFMEKVVAKGKERFKEYGLAFATTVGGRRVAVPKSRLYALCNYIMQGGGADIMKMALIRMEDVGLGQYLRLVVHDEVIICVPPGDEGAAIAKQVAECMRTTFRGVPFDVEISGPAASWGAVK